jgi:hypothetical protein
MSETRSKPRTSVVKKKPSYVLPLECWLKLSHANPQAFGVLARVSRFFSRALTTEAAFRERTHAYLTAYPKLEVGEDYQTYFSREYQHLRVLKLENDGYLDPATTTTRTHLLAILNVCIDRGFEHIAKRILHRLQTFSLTEEECYAGFTPQGLYTNNNPVIPQLLLDLIRSHPVEVQHRILARACCRSLAIKETNFLVAHPRTVTLFWQQLPENIRKEFFLTGVPPWEELLPKGLEITSEESREMANTFMVSLSSCKYSNIHFIVDSLPVNKRAHIMKLALTLQCLSTFSMDDRFISQHANGIRVILDMLPEAERLKTTHSLIEPAMLLFREGRAALPMLRLPNPILMRLQADVNLEDRKRKKRRLAKIFLAILLMAREEREHFLPALEQLRENHAEDFQEILLDTVLHAITVDIKKEIIAILLLMIQATKRTELVYNQFLIALTHHFPMSAVILFLEAMQYCNLFLPVLKMLMGSNPDQFKRLSTLSIQLPWQQLMQESIYECMQTGIPYVRIVPFLENFLSLPVTRSAMRVVIVQSPSITRRLLKTLEDAPSELCVAAVECFAMWINKSINESIKDIHDGFIRYAEKKNDPHLFYEMAKFDVEHQTDTVSAFCSIMPFKSKNTKKKMALVVNLLDAEPHSEEETVLLKAFATKLDIGEIFLILAKMFFEKNSEKLLSHLKSIFERQDAAMQRDVIVRLIKVLGENKFDVGKGFLSFIGLLIGESDSDKILRWLAEHVLFDLLNAASARDAIKAFRLVIPDKLIDLIHLLIAQATEKRNRTVACILMCMSELDEHFALGYLNSLDSKTKQFLIESIAHVSAPALVPCVELWSRSAVASLRNPDTISYTAAAMKSAFSDACQEYVVDASHKFHFVAKFVCMVIEKLNNHTRCMRPNDFIHYEEFSLKLIFFALKDYLDEKNGKRFLFKLAKHLSSFSYLSEDRDAFFQTHQVRIDKMKVIFDEVPEQNGPDGLCGRFLGVVLVAFQKQPSRGLLKKKM